MKLNVKTTLTVTTDDLEIICNPPLTLEAIGTIDPNTRQQLVAWYRRDYAPTEESVNFIPKLFLSVSQNGTSYPLTTEADAQALKDSLGDKFTSLLVRGYWNYEAGYFEKKVTGSANSLPISATGSENEPTP